MVATNQLAKFKLGFLAARPAGHNTSLYFKDGYIYYWGCKNHELRIYLDSPFPSIMVVR